MAVHIERLTSEVTVQESELSLTPAQVRSILEDTARPVAKRFTSDRPLIVVPITPGDDGYNDDAGAGLVDANTALQQTPD